jgi:peptide/nickel transport system substrate-binding protein
MLNVWRKPSHFVVAATGIALSAALTATGPASAQEKAITVVLVEELADFDICNTMRSTNGRVLRQNVGEALTKIDPTSGEVSPLLATSWEQISDGAWRFHLRQGVTFHDGSPFNAEAVAKAIHRTYHADPFFCENASKSGLKKDEISTEVVDDHTIDIKMTRAAPILPVQLGTISITHPNAPSDRLETTKPLGTGPYVFASFTTGTDIVLKRYDNYWGDKPEVETARFIFRAESAVQAAMVAIGEADLAPSIAVQDATDPTMDFSYLNSETTRLRIEAKVPPLNDKRVRLALNYAIDREAMRGSVFSKDALPATQHVVPSIAGHNHEIDKRVWPFDVAKAKALLAEAKADGVPVDTEITIICRLGQWPGAQESMETILGYYLELGLNVKLRCLEQAQHSQMNNKPFAQDRGPILFQDQHDNNNGDAVFTVFTKYGCEGSQSTVCSPEVDKLALDAAALPIGPERVAKFQEAFRLIYEEVVADVPLFHMVGYTRVGKRINYQPSIATNSEVELALITFK